tara:strand:+ start:736 stop:1563 length:828 start_codon:yes stop_codon:yes gene_type:complete
MAGPFQQSWLILKKLSQRDLLEASQFGMPSRMQRFPADHPLNPDLVQGVSGINYPQSRGGQGMSDTIREYNEAMFPDEEAYERQINTPTPLSPSTPEEIASMAYGEQALQGHLDDDIREERRAHSDREAFNEKINQMGPPFGSEREDALVESMRYQQDLQNAIRQRMRTEDRLDRRREALRQAQIPISPDDSMADPRDMSSSAADAAMDYIRDTQRTLSARPPQSITDRASPNLPGKNFFNNPNMPRDRGYRNYFNTIGSIFDFDDGTSMLGEQI